ncbi:P1 family peptidase [Saccharopolyspora taberi]|uniref:P1 family peptidase n=1 Tax=Saccharopolyspora taberi TaxID=60895 RepID=A0ABN3VEZ7_9PSEU
MPAPASSTVDGRPRARGLGIPFAGRPGPVNAITDVTGVEVGYTTLVHGEGPLRSGEGPVRSGVTAILPRGRSKPAQPCAAGWFALNGNGEMTGTSWIEEVGALTTPVLITNTHAVGPCHQGAIDWMVGRGPARGWLMPVVAETFDGYLNDINGGHVRAEHAVSALESAAGGPIAEGSVGGGTGMNCYGFKGGSGTASRLVRHGADEYAVGAFVQANFGARRHLTVAGRPVGLRIAAENPMEDRGWLAPPGAGSVIVVVATDAPLLPGQCKALARRVPLGLGRTGTIGSHFSGDLFLAFSTANEGALTSEFDSDRTYETLRFVPWGGINPFYEAVIQCVEEAVLNALVVNETMVGRDGHRSPALPHDELLRCLREGNVELGEPTS